jgi:1-aminocyclopropane-1-carboxylate deaminase
LNFPSLSKGADYLLNTYRYHFGGYGKTTPELIDFVKEFVAETGILIEPIYTGKMLYALFDLARKDHFKPGDRNTGHS